MFDSKSFAFAVASGIVLSGILVSALAATETSHASGLQVGAAVADVTPDRLPVPMAGMFLVRYAEKIHSRLKVRAIALADDRLRMVIAVVDSVGVPREILDEAKRQASRTTGIPADKMLISATHTHTAPPVRTAHGTDPDPQYAELLVRGIVEAIERAAKNLVPAKAGAAVADARDFAAVRRWVLRPDRMREDPFGNNTVRASMHTASNHDNVTGPSGPMDPDLSLVSFQTLDGKPIALLANFANHYAGAPKVDGELAISADYFGLFADTVEERLSRQSPADGAPGFVAIMSQGTSGDIATRDYWHLDRKRAVFEDYTQRMVELALEAYAGIDHRDDVTLDMAQSELAIPYQTPDAQRLEWARRVYGELGNGRVPENLQEVYARHALYLDRRQGTKLLLQAVRIGDVGITAIPNEVYGLTGLRLKELSPLPTTINIELANGSEGYLPPPEQHVLGGYNTWPALSACLHVNAEPRIVQTLLQLLEKVSSEPRRLPPVDHGPAAEAVLQAEPVSYFRMSEFAGPRAVDSNARHDGIYESGVVFYLAGPRGAAFSNSRRGNRAAHFAGGRMRVAGALPADAYSVSLWFWNGLLTDTRPITGYLFSQDRDWGLGPTGVHLGIGGAAANQGRLIFHSGEGAGAMASGRSQLKRWQWHHVVMIRDGDRVRIHLDGAPEAEIDVEVPAPAGPLVQQMFVGGRSDSKFNFEGRIDEVALFDRPLSAAEIGTLYAAAGEAE